MRHRGEAKSLKGDRGNHTRGESRLQPLRAQHAARARQLTSSAPREENGRTDMLLASFADAFLSYKCDCCGRAFGGRFVYREGLMQCVECASGQHRHERTAAAA